MFLIITFSFIAYVFLVWLFILKLDVLVITDYFENKAFYHKYKARIQEVELLGWNVQTIIDKIALIYLVIFGAIIYIVSINKFTNFDLNPLYVRLIAIGLFLSPIAYYKYCNMLRKNAIKNELSDILELILTSLKAGISYDKCLGFIIMYIKNKYILIELKKLKNDLLWQDSENKAWELFKERVQYEKSVITIVNILQESSSLGVAIFDDLTLLMHNNKKVKAYDVEEQSSKVSTKSNIIVLLFGAPCITIFILGPHIIDFLYQYQLWGI